MMLLPRKVKKLKRLIGRSVVHGQHRVPEAFQYFFGTTANHIGGASWPTSQVEQEPLARDGYPWAMAVGLTRVGLALNRPVVTVLVIRSGSRAAELAVMHNTALTFAM
jgi:hypothetical protein